MSNSSKKRKCFCSYSCFSCFPLRLWKAISMLKMIFQTPRSKELFSRCVLTIWFNSFSPSLLGHKNSYQQHYERLQKNPHFQSLSFNTSLDRKPIDLSYKCIHDEVVQQALASDPNYFTAPEIDNVDMPEEDNRKRQTFQRIRIAVNTHLLQGQADPRACYRVGAVVPGRTCRSQDLLSGALKSLFNAIALAVVEVWSNHYLTLRSFKSF